METTIVNTEKSTHIVPVIEIKFDRHPNADALSLVHIDDYVCCVKTSDWKEGQLAAWLPPDSEVDVKRPEFSFLGNKSRIKVKKLRGIVSYGLLVPAPEGSKVGDNVADILGVSHYELKIKEENTTSGEVAKAPPGVYPKYDVDAYLKYGRKVFIEGELVYLSEKLNGSNSKYVYKDGIHCGSRTEFKKEYPEKSKVTLEHLLKQFNGDEVKANNVYQRIQNSAPKKNLWWAILDNTPSIKTYCEKNPGFTLYGEVFGHVGGYPYSGRGAQFAAFDILKPDCTWMDFPEFLKIVKEYQIPYAPIIHEAIPFHFEEMLQFAEGNSLIPGANHIREGCVIGSVVERWDDRLGRVKLKIINPEY